MPVISTVVKYVALKCIDQFIKEEGYGRLKRLLFPKRKYENELYTVISQTISEFEEEHHCILEGVQFPFYHAQAVFDILSRHILFTNVDERDMLHTALSENPNIFIPSPKVLDEFYGLFLSKARTSKHLRALFIEERHRERIFEISETINVALSEIRQVKTIVEEIRQESVFQPNTAWFSRRCKLALSDLGPRYSPHINVKLDISEVFELLGRTARFRISLRQRIGGVLLKGRKALTEHAIVKEPTSVLANSIDEFQRTFESIEVEGTIDISLQPLSELLARMSDELEAIDSVFHDEEKRIAEEKKEYRFYHQFGSDISNNREFERDMDSLANFLSSNAVQLVNNRILLLTGEAGIGKSHLLGDVVTQRMADGYESVFILGQHLVSEEEPWTQIFKRLQLKTTAEEFLSAINERGRATGKRIFFIIDAVNEGKGKFFWESYVMSFAEQVLSYPWIALVLSVRDSYKPLIFPEHTIRKIRPIEITLRGFEDVEYEASKLFFDAYGIEQPSIPLLHPEFQNPLFLKLFCEGIQKAGYTRIPDGLQGITSIIDFFLKNVNQRLSKPSSFNFSADLNLVQRAVDAVISFKVRSNGKYISVIKAHEVVNSELSPFIERRGFVEELVSEGVFSKNIYWREDGSYEEGIYLAYERFEDHLIVGHLLRQIDEPFAAFKEGGVLAEYCKDEYALFVNFGLVSALSIQLPEKKGIELFDALPSLRDKSPVVEGFLNSLLWRKVSTINAHSVDYVNDVVCSEIRYYDRFWDIHIATATIPGHYFNAHHLHEHLMSVPLADRDGDWSTWLSGQLSESTAVKRLIDWSLSDQNKSHIDDEAMELATTTLFWMFSTSDRKVRDLATKACVKLLQNRLVVLLRLMKKFENVNDPYVYERLFAVAYGVAVRTSERDKLPLLSQCVYDMVFSPRNEVYPHVLLRDYARNVIEYVVYLGMTIGFDIKECRPPYRSVWPSNISTAEELQKQEDDNKLGEVWSSVMAGDFGRYVIGTNGLMRHFSGVRRGETGVDREQLLADFLGSLTDEQRNLYEDLSPFNYGEAKTIGFRGSDDSGDDDIDDDDDDDDNDDDDDDSDEYVITYRTVESRKSDEELQHADKLFKDSLHRDQLQSYKDDLEPYFDENRKFLNTKRNFDLRIAERFVLQRVLSLGWTPERFGNFDRNIGPGRRRREKYIERIGKKYQWIAYHEYMARLADNFKWNSKEEGTEDYNGPWEPNMRDIDPSITIQRTMTADMDFPGIAKCDWWSFEINTIGTKKHTDWISESDDVPPAHSLICLLDPDKEEWLVLSAHPEWAEPAKFGVDKWERSHQRMWCRVTSYLAKRADLQVIREQLTEDLREDLEFPDPTSYYDIFSREFCWAPAYKDRTRNEEEWEYITATPGRNVVANVEPTTDDYRWGAEFDYSKASTLAIVKPCKTLFEGMEMKVSEVEGQFLDKEGNLVCLAADVNCASREYFLIRKKAFLDFLDANELAVVWKVDGEKNIIGGRHTDRFYGRSNIWGVFFMHDNNLDGQLKYWV